MKMVGGADVETVVAHDVIGRLMIQCARQPGLAQVWNDVLGFEGCEFYTKEWSEIEGLSFDEVAVRFADAQPIGILRDETVLINPPRHEAMRPRDELIVIAEDDDSYESGAVRDSSSTRVEGAPTPERSYARLGERAAPPRRASGKRHFLGPASRRRTW